MLNYVSFYFQKEADSSADEQCLSVNFPEEDIRLSPEISEGFLSSNLQFHPMPVSLETRARSGPMRRQVFSEMTVNADRREQETCLSDTYRELCPDEFKKALSTTDNDTCDTFACTCSFGKTNYSGQCVVKMTGGGHPQTMEATHAENNRQDNLYNLVESSSKQASQVEPSSCTCNCDKLLVNDNTDKDSLNSDCDENSSYTHGHNLSRHTGRVACDLPQRCTADALLAQFLT